VSLNPFILIESESKRRVSCEFSCNLERRKQKFVHPSFIGGVFLAHILELVFVLGFQRHYFDSLALQIFSI
jgi:hypothetical protein